MAKNQSTKKIFLIMTFFYWISQYLYTPTLPAYASRIGASEQMIGLIVGGYGLTQILFRIPFGVLSDKMRKRKLFINIGMFFALLSPLGMALFPTPAGLFIFRCFTGIAASAWVNCTVLFPSYYPDDKSSTAISKLNTYCTVGCLLAGLFGGQLVENLGQIKTFYITALVGLIALILSFLIKDHMPDNTTPLTLNAMKELFGNQELLHISLLALMFQFIQHGTSSSFTPILASSVGATASQLGILLMSSTVGMLIASTTVNKYILPYIKFRDFLIINFILIALCMITMPFATTLITLLILQLIIGFCGFGNQIAILIQCIRFVDEEKRGAAMGFVQAIYSAGMFLGPVVMGQIAGIFSLSSAFFFIAGFALLAAFLSLRWMKKIQ
jgi:predicted MFS family arabinose efflux permease